MSQLENLIIVLAPTLLGMAIVVVAFVGLRPALETMLAGMAVQRVQARFGGIPASMLPDSALSWTPGVISVQQLLTVALAIALVVTVAFSFVAPMFIAFALAAPVAGIGVLATIRIAEDRYVQALNKDLGPAIGRVAALLANGRPLRQALQQVADRLDATSPLRAEWYFLVERNGAMMRERQGIATISDVLRALSVQTPSTRHAAFLRHMAAVVNQAQEAQTSSAMRASEAILRSDNRAEEAKTALSQIWASALVIGGAAILMNLYLFLTQTEKFISAYSSPLGIVVGLMTVFFNALPIATGYLLSRVSDMDY